MTSQLFQIYKKLSENDMELLYHLYLYRCLTFEQAKTFIYHSNENPQTFYHNEITPLLEADVVEELEYKPNEYVLFLTTNGVDIVRENREIPLEIFNSDTKIVKRGYYRAGELKLKPRLVNHQVHLNQFVLEFQQKAKELGIKWKYFDEKYASQYFTIRPDGLIQIFDTDFFLEMDMGTESKKQLFDKWDNYRDFVRSGEFTNRERNIVVLFITENVKNKEARKELVHYTVAEKLLDLLEDSFDMVVGSKDELLSIMLDIIVPNIHGVDEKKEKRKQTLSEKHDFKVDDAQPLRKALNDMDYEFYIRKTAPNSNHIATEYGRLQEYVLDDYSYEPLAVLNRIQYHKKSASIFHMKFKRKIPYIVISENIEHLWRDLNLANVPFEDDVFFTTLERLETLPFHQALFQFDSEGNPQGFLNSGLEERLVEQNVS